MKLTALILLLLLFFWQFSSTVYEENTSPIDKQLSEVQTPGKSDSENKKQLLEKRRIKVEAGSENKELKEIRNKKL